MKCTRRFLRVVALVFVLAALVVAALGVYVIRRPFPVVQGQLRVPGVRAPVEIIRDRWGIPHIFAQTVTDLVFAQGYVHAQDRLWQMEFNRRIASGRLSEIFGDVTLKEDRFLRTVGLRRSAELDLAQLDPETRSTLESYAAGVNAYITQNRRRLPVEFTVLRFAPEPWTPVDTLAFAKLMAWVLGGNWESEILRAHILSRFGPAAAHLLLPPYPGNHPVVLQPAVSNAFRSRAILNLLDVAPRATGIGSNNWVLSGTRTSTGRPILANDPHLEAQMPSIWYEMHLSGGGYDAIGSTFPGTPGVIIGHNASIAWGVTNAGPDVMDLYIERFDAADPTRYEYRGRWERAQIVREEIRVKGRDEPVVEAVRITRHGPILNNVEEGLDAFLALRWTGLDASTTSASVLRIGRARNWDEFRDALRLWTVPAQNFVYADREGNIGYQLPGRIPIRAKGRGGVPVPGWTGQHEWIGEIPFDALPSMLNPARGYVVTANNRIVPDGYPHFISSEWDPGYRARRIEALVGASGPDLEQMKKVQADLTSIPGQLLIGALHDVQAPTEPAAGLLRELLGWDGVLHPDSRAAAIYEVFRITLLEEIFSPVLGQDLFERYRRHAQFWQVALLRILQDPTSPWWGTEGRDALVTRALTRATRTLTAKLGPDRAAWQWGRLHVMRFVHPLGRVPALGRIFNATSPPTGGDAFTVNNGGFNSSTFTQAVVASYRQILDVGDWDRSISIHTTGQSGLPFHKHYRDFVPLWASGRYHPMLFTRARIEQDAAGTLSLVPAQPAE